MMMVGGSLYLHLYLIVENAVSLKTQKSWLPPTWMVMKKQ